MLWIIIHHSVRVIPKSYTHHLKIQWKKRIHAYSRSRESCMYISTEIFYFVESEYIIANKSIGIMFSCDYQKIIFPRFFCMMNTSFFKYKIIYFLIYSSVIKYHKSSTGAQRRNKCFNHDYNLIKINDLFKFGLM